MLKSALIQRDIPWLFCKWFLSDLLILNLNPKVYCAMKWTRNDFSNKCPSSSLLPPSAENIQDWRVGQTPRSGENSWQDGRTEWVKGLESNEMSKSTMWLREQNLNSKSANDMIWIEQWRGWQANNISIHPTRSRKSTCRYSRQHEQCTHMDRKNGLCTSLSLRTA